MVLMAAQGIGQRIIAYIYQDVQVMSPDRLEDHPLSFSGTEAGDLCLQEIGITLIAGESKGFLVLAFSFRSPFYQVAVDFLA
jgi:hypothetical protein